MGISLDVISTYKLLKSIAMAKSSVVIPIFRKLLTIKK